MSTIGRLTDEQSRTWRGYLLMHTRLVAALGRHLQDTSGLSASDFEVLAQLSDAPGGRLRPYELQDALDWDQSRLSHHLTRMQKRLLVRREDCTQDGRGSLIVLADAGRDAFAAALPAHVERVCELFFDVLTPEQVETLGQLATQVSTRIDATRTDATRTDATRTGTTRTAATPSMQSAP